MCAALIFSGLFSYPITRTIYRTPPFFEETGTFILRHSRHVSVFPFQLDEFREITPEVNSKACQECRALSGYFTYLRNLDRNSTNVRLKLHQEAVSSRTAINFEFTDFQSRISFHAG